MFLAAGTKSFDLGSLILDSLKTDKPTYYAKGPIILTVKTIGKGEADLSLLLNDLPFRDEGKMAFDGEKSLGQSLEILKAGEHRIRARLKAGDLISEKKVLVNMVDTQPPTTSLAMSDSCWVDRGQRSEEIVALAENSCCFFAQDNFAVEGIEISIDSGSFRPCTSPISIKKEGEHLLTYRARDINGNIEEDKELKVLVDLSPPEIIQSFPSKGSYLRKDDLSLLKLIFSEEIELEGGIGLWESRTDKGILTKNLTYDSGTNRILFGLAESLEDNHEYRIEIGQGIRDLIGHVLLSQTITFYALTRKEIGGVVRKDSACVSVPPDALPEDAYLRIEPSNQRRPPYSIPNSVFDYLAVNAKGDSIASFNGSLGLEISYPDEDNDGLVDGTNIKETTLRMGYLNEATSGWELVGNSRVFADSNTVMAGVNHFSTFGLLSVNLPPVLDPIGDKTVDEGGLLQFAITATDPDGDSLTYSAANLPSGASFDSATRTFNWRPAYDQAGGYQDLLFEVVDNGSPQLSDSETMTITVNNTNRPPVPDLIGNKSVNEGETLSFEVSASDPDGVTIAFTKKILGLPCYYAFANSR